MPTEFTVEFPAPHKRVIYREGSATCAFDTKVQGKRVEIDFGHSCDPTSFGGGAFDYGSTSTHEQRQIAPRVVEWLERAGYTVDAAGLHDDRWCPSHYKK